MFRKLNTARKIVAVILLAAIVATLYFIWSNSMESVQESNQTSQGVYEVVEPIIESTVGTDVVTPHVFRKMAHVGEFFMLGAEVVTLFFVLVGFNFRITPFSLIIGFVIGGIDEILQIFSSRGPAFTDVLIDFFGFAVAWAIVTVVAFICNRIRLNKKAKAEIKP